jgi:paraquat-inducible protein B
MVSGVRVGSVKEVLIHFNQADGDAFMPVIIEVDDALLNDKTDKTFLLNDPKLLEQLVEEGLRARLEAESLVTGVLYVDLSVLPNAPPPVYHQVKPMYQEIPSAPTQIQMLLENLARIDIAGLYKELQTVLDSLNSTLQELRMQEINAGVTNLLSSLNTIAASPELTNSLASLNRSLAEVERLAERLQKAAGPLGDEARKTLTEAQATLVELRLAAENVQGLLAPDAPLSRDLAGALEQLRHAARSVGDLADYLSRNPNALLSGRKPKESVQ